MTAIMFPDDASPAEVAELAAEQRALRAAMQRHPASQRVPVTLTAVYPGISWPRRAWNTIRLAVWTW